MRLATAWATIVLTLIDAMGGHTQVGCGWWDVDGGMWMVWSVLCSRRAKLLKSGCSAWIFVLGIESRLRMTNVSRQHS